MKREEESQAWKNKKRGPPKWTRHDSTGDRRQG